MFMTGDPSGPNVTGSPLTDQAHCSDGDERVSRKLTIIEAGTGLARANRTLPLGEPRHADEGMIAVGPVEGASPVLHCMFSARGISTTAVPRIRVLLTVSLTRTSSRIPPENSPKESSPETEPTAAAAPVLGKPLT
jgi:hypothetical protein